MPKRKLDSRALRQLADDVLQCISGACAIPEYQRDDLATSLVRQWITYDENATLFLGDSQFDFEIVRTPLGKLRVAASPPQPGWTKRLIRDWKVSPDDLPETFDQLNRGQSAEVINGDGVPLRLWADPKRKASGVEPLVKEQRQTLERDYFRIATDTIEERLGKGLDAEELEALAHSLARQWQQHQGHGGIYLDEHWLQVFRLTEQAGGGCVVAAVRRRSELAPLFSSLGFPPEEFAHVIAKINLGQEIEFHNRQGVRCRLEYDPKAMRIAVKEIGRVPPPGRMPPIVCPKCSATLRPWRAGERQQACALCGLAVSRD